MAFRISPKTVSLWAGPVIALGIISLLKLDPGNPMVTRMAAVTVWMAIWWVSEAVSLPVTALLPVILFPLLGIMTGKETAPHYFDSILFLFMGGFIIAIAMERWALHRRIALTIIRTVGAGRYRLLLGFMLATGFLSMWISNTATTMMMVPIAMAVLAKLEEQAAATLTRYGTGLFLAIAYAANIGGISTLIGTPPNLAFGGIFSDQYPTAPSVTFTQWMGFGLPVALVMLVFAWGLLVFRYAQSSQEHPKGQNAVGCDVFNEQYKALGPILREEVLVLAIFIATALLWVTRSTVVLGTMAIPGWGTLLPGVDDGTVAITMALLLFVIPTRKSDTGRLLHWDDLQHFPWGILLLFGGGFALADGFQRSGLSQWLGQQLLIVRDLHPALIVSATAGTMTFLTEFTSNTPSTQMLLPLLASLANVAGLHPLLLMIPATISASFAFMLPVATPPNAIIGTRRVPVIEMAKTGLIMNLLGMIVVSSLIFLLGSTAFGIQPETPPAWAMTP